MFQSLSDRLAGIFDGLRRSSRLTEEDVAAALREIRVALLEADVALPVVKDFVANIQEKAVGQEVIKSVTPAQQVVKIVNDALVEMLGGTGPQNTELNLGAQPPAVILMAGLQGSGKTTTTAKIAVYLREKLRKKALLASLDVQRPAAQEQLRQLGEQTNIATLPIVAGESPLKITERALKVAKLEGYDVLILDTAGRLSIDDELMEELAAVKKLSNPSETLLVADAMTGQDAVHTATNFNERIGITGIVLTRVDGDARGGAALSLRAVTGQPLKFIGVGEKWDALEPFHPDRIAGRILGMGDVVSLVEKAVETMDQDEAARMAQKFQEGKFDLNDMLSQFRQMQKMGGMGSLMKMLPGMSQLTAQIDESKLDDRVIKRQEAIILSMTKAERSKPALLNASRKKRVAAGSGTSVQDVNRLIKQYEQMETVMRRIKKMGMGGMLNAMKGMMGSKDADLLSKAQSGELELPGEMPKGLPGLGNFTPPAGGLPGLGAGSPFGGGGLFGQRGGSKKNRRKK